MPTAPATGADSSPPDVVDWAREQRTLSALAAFTADALAISGPQAAAEQVPGATVTGAFFDVLAVSAARGRTLTEADARQRRRAGRGDRRSPVAATLRA